MTGETLERFKSKLVLNKKEVEISYSRSSGRGGQHVNKTSSKVKLWFPIQESRLLNEATKARMLQKYANSINRKGQLLITNQSDRSQQRNLDLALD